VVLEEFECVPGMIGVCNVCTLFMYLICKGNIVVRLGYALLLLFHVFMIILITYWYSIVASTVELFKTRGGPCYWF
jgi:hypothetical protein